jgi:hypothetical protein
MSVIASDAGRPTRGLLPRFLLGRATVLVLLGLVLVALAPPAYLLQTGGMLTTGYNIQRLQQERSAWIVKNEQLEAELAKARSLAWIEHEAVTRLGMQPASQPTIVRMDVPPPPVASTQLATRESSMPMPMPSTESAPADAGLLGEIVEAVTGLIAGW